MCEKISERFRIFSVVCIMDFIKYFSKMSSDKEDSDNESDYELETVENSQNTVMEQSEIDQSELESIGSFAEKPNLSDEAVNEILESKEEPTTPVLDEPAIKQKPKKPKKELSEAKKAALKKAREARNLKMREKREFKKKQKELKKLEKINKKREEAEELEKKRRIAELKRISNLENYIADEVEKRLKQLRNTEKPNEPVEDVKLRVSPELSIEQAVTPPKAIKTRDTIYDEKVTLYSQLLGY